MTTPDLRTVIPHSGRMSLLDRIVEASEDTLTTEITVREGSLFLADGGVGAWVGLEYMAQTAAALAGHRALREGGVVRPGVLLGARQYGCSCPRFPVGCTLRVTARIAAGSSAEVSSYDCRLAGDGIEAAATLTIYHGDRLETELTEERA